MDDPDNKVSGLQLSNNTYNNMKFVVLIVLPALGILYASLSQFWGFPKVQEVVGTINALALFLGIILRISGSSFAASPQGRTPEGSFIISKDEEGNKKVTLEFDQDPADFIDQGTLTFNVKKAE